MRKFHPYAVAAEAKGQQDLSPEYRPARCGDAHAVFRRYPQFQPACSGVRSLSRYARTDRRDPEVLRQSGHALREGRDPHHHRRFRGPVRSSGSASSTTATRSSSPSPSTPTTTPWSTPRGAQHPSHPHLSRGGLSLRRPCARSKPASTSTPAPSCVTNPGNPTGVVLTPRRDAHDVRHRQGARPVHHRRRGLP